VVAGIRRFVRGTGGGGHASTGRASREAGGEPVAATQTLEPLPSSAEARARRASEALARRSAAAQQRAGEADESRATETTVWAMRATAAAVVALLLVVLLVILTALL
jgi:type VI protein secretion system component VasF